MIKLIELLQEITGKSKAIFLAGPAGSGKSYITKQILPSNFTTINVDDTYEELLKARKEMIVNDEDNNKRNVDLGLKFDQILKEKNKN